MNDLTLIQIDRNVKQWLSQSRQLILTKMAERMTVNEKSGRKDLVTNVDRENEKFLINKIKTFNPDSVVLGEEGFGDQVSRDSGWIWVLDPIDGTMNFVKQRDHFAVMLALFVNGRGVLGYIFDVMNNVLYSGGPDLGVFVNGNRLGAPANTTLEDGLVSISAPLLMADQLNLLQVAKASSGIRMYGSAGIEMAHLLMGKITAYISYLKPWDFAAGKILGEALGLVATTVDGQPLDMLSSNLVMVATKNAQRGILPIIGQNG